jgi:sugar/nucleoside kinase (ribokinase family)
VKDWQPMDIVCFGPVSRLLVAQVEEYPQADSGADVSSLLRQVAADAPIISLILSRLGCKVGLIGNDLGDDGDGRDLLDLFGQNDIVTTISLRSEVETPITFTVVDRDGNRTWFSSLRGAAENLSTARLDLAAAARLFYVDAYAVCQQASIRAIDFAIQMGIPVLVNLGDDAPGDELIQCLRQGVSIVQSSAEGHSIEQAKELAQTHLQAYRASLSVVTMGKTGVSYAARMGTFHLPAHTVRVVNTAGAGSAFSAGLIFGRLQSWSSEEAVIFANALAALYCSVPNGIGRFSPQEVLEFVRFE